MVFNKSIIMVAAILLLVSSAIVFITSFDDYHLVETQETEENNVKFAKLLDPTERNITGRFSVNYLGSEHVNFTWIPENPEDVTIIAVYVSFEYRCEGALQTFWDTGEIFEFRIMPHVWINDIYRAGGSSITIRTSEKSRWEQYNLSSWTAYYSELEGLRERPWFQIDKGKYDFAVFIEHGASPVTAPTFVRNVSIILEVIK